MSGVDDLKAPTPSIRRRGGVRRFRWNCEDYQKLAELEIFRNRRVQLINGEIIEMSPQNSPHSDSVENLDEILRDAFGRGFRVRTQLPLDLAPSSMPEPDALVLVRKPKGSHPKGGVLVVEVSDSSLDFDRNVKSQIYAQADIPEYWICNIPDRQLEVHRHPEPDPDRPGKFRYAETTVVPADGSVSPLARPESRIVVADLLP